MSKRNSILTLVLLALPLSAALGQDSAQQDSSQQPSTTPAPAFGVDTGPAPVAENPPISGVDQPNLEPHAAPLSYLQPSLHVSEAADSNVTDTLGNSAFHSDTFALGSLELQRLWSHYDLALDYVGGVGYYSARGVGIQNLEQFDVNQKITWKRGELGIRDAFSYMPQGSFAGAYGSTNGLGQSVAAGTPGTFWGGTTFGSLGQVPRIMNLSLADVTEYLSPKSSLTAAVGYGFVHFTGNTEVQGISFLGDTQLSAQGGYNRILGPHDQAALVYGYQAFSFSTSGLSFHSNIVQLMWGHRISGRMDFLVGAGPQFTGFSEAGSSDSQVSVAAKASLRYKFPKTMLSLTYQRYNTNGSGFFAGAETDTAQLSASRPLSRVWSVTADLGYAHNRRELPLTLQQQLECEFSATSSSVCAGVAAKIFDYGFAGVALHRMLGRNFHIYASYQFDELSFDSSFCGVTATGTSLAPCNRISQRQVGTLGLDWRPRPIRLD
ncbi:MAG TPA: hypothetical protein VIH89_19165 [Candidatus Sulfotelmatobacter sp.]